MQHRSAKGTTAVFADELLRSRRLIETFRRSATLLGFNEAATPPLEHAELFAAPTTEPTRVLPAGRNDAQPSSRAQSAPPSASARALRLDPRVSRLFYMVPQLRQAGCEISGDPGPTCDAELIELLCALCDELGVGPVKVRINSVGSAEARNRYRQALLDYLRPRAEDLSERVRSRIGTNPLRIFDSADPRDLEAMQGAPCITDVLDGADCDYWLGLQGALTRLGTAHTVDARLISGLDYFTHTLFEIHLARPRAGMPVVLVRGGRYDAMLVRPSGSHTPAIGCSLQVDAILRAMSEPAKGSLPLCLVALEGPNTSHEAYGLAREMRRLGVRVAIDARGDAVDEKLDQAGRAGARMCVVLDEESLSTNQVWLSDLSSRTRELVPRENAAFRVIETLGTPRPPPASPSGSGT